MNRQEALFRNHSSLNSLGGDIPSFQFRNIFCSHINWSFQWHPSWLTLTRSVLKLRLRRWLV